MAQAKQKQKTTKKTATQTKTAEDREALAQRIAGAFAKFCTHKSDIVHLWAEFAKLQSGETIMKCRTKTEFCEKVLGRSIRTVQYMIQGGNFKRSTPTHETVSPAPITGKMREPEPCMPVYVREPESPAIYAQSTRTR
jgi:hypothetical protein